MPPSEALEKEGPATRNVKKQTAWSGLLLPVLAVLAAILARPLLLAPLPDASAPANDSGLWVATESSLIRVESADGSITLEIPGMQQPRAVALDQQRGAVWVFGKDYLRCFTTTGVLLVSGTAPKDHEGEPAHLAAVPADGSVWLASGKVLFHFNAQAQALATVVFPDKIQALQLDMPRSVLWAATGDAATALDPSTGSVVCSFGLGKNAGLQDLAISPATGDVWMALKDSVRRYTAHGQVVAQVDLKKVVAIAGDGQGRLWAATDKELLRLEASALPSLAVALPKDAGATVAVVADLGTSTTWVATQHGLTHVSAFGEILGILDFHKPEHHVRAIAFPGDVLVPVLHITEPADGTFTNNPAPSIKVDYSDAGFGVNPESLAFKAGEDPLEVTCEREDTNATCTPTNNLQDGTIDLTATVKDFAGNTSEPAKVTFTVDTISPQITLTSPAEGGITNQKDQTLSGSLSETATLKVSGQPAQVNEDRSFSYGPLTLIEGLNTFDLEATDPAGNVGTLQLNLTLDTVPPQITLTSPTNGSITNRQQQTFSGSLSEAGTLTLNGQPVTVDTGHTFSHGPVTLSEGANTFTLKATDSAGNVGSLAVTVTLDTVLPASPDTAKVTVGPPSGGQVAVSGSAGAVEAGATVVIANLRTAGTVTVATGADGSFAGSIGGETGDTLRLIAIDLAGNASAAISLVVPGSGGPTLPPDPAAVAPPLDPTVATDPYTATEFLYTGPNPIQTGVASGTIEPRRVAILRGRVLDRNGAPLPGVAITVKDHPELGQTVSRVDGMFDLAVNGGGVLTIDYRKDELLPAQRQVNAPWQDWAWLPDVVLIPQDPLVTAIDLTQPVMQVARGSVVTDGDGTRQATLLFPAGTTAELVMPDGTRQPISTLHVRATEYTVGERGPEAMPAELPANVAYTSCVNFTADEEAASGADVIDFSQPLIYYLDNFLHFPVGGSVPLGKYDPSLGAWAAAESGRIVQVLSVNGVLAELDVDGLGSPADAAKLAALGVTDAERQQLASLYQAGTSLWRMRIPHFSRLSWDSNWGFLPGRPPDGAVFAGKTQGCKTCSSIIEIQPQILGETAAVVGTPFGLNYRSDRVRGRGADYTLGIILSRATVPEGLQRIELEVLVGGRFYEQTFSNAPNQTTTFTWDGLDAYGRALQGRRLATVRIGYTYSGGYQQVAGFGYNGNGVPITGSLTRREVTTWQVIQSPIGAWDALGERLGGWTLSAHHRYDPVGRVLLLGDGTWRAASSIDAVVTTVAGNGRFGYTGDGGPATQASFHAPSALAVAPDGSVYVSDSTSNCIRRVGPDGIIRTVAGEGHSGYSGDGGPATRALLNSPHGVAIGPDGSLYISDTWNQCIRRVGADGIIATVVGHGGNANFGYGGDGGPANQAFLKFPLGITFGPDGSLYIADNNNHRIRRVTPDGIITSLTDAPCNWYFGCEGGFSGDGGPAVRAKLRNPTDVAVGPDGSLYILDSGNDRIRRIGLDGIITTVAGNGQEGYSGDGGLATSAALSIRGAAGLAVSPGGTMYIADVSNLVIRCVSPNGIISTCVGRKSSQSILQEGGPALQNCLWFQPDVALTPDGALLTIATSNRIVKVAGTLPNVSVGSVTIPSEDGSEVFLFDAAGRHLSTVDARTGAVRAQFGYDAAGLLTTITDGDGNVVRIERGGSGDATAIVSPDGQRTFLSMDANSYLASVTDPSGQTTRFAYTTDGLLTSRTDPLGNTSTLTYDDQGLLVKDEDAAGGFKALSGTRTDTDLTVTLTTGEGRSTTYTVTQLPNGNESRTVSEAGCACSESETIKAADGSTTTTSRDGTVSYQQVGPDPRFGMQAPVMATARVTAPSGLQSVTSASRAVALADPLDFFSIQTQTDTVTVNGKSWTTKYDASTKKITTTSPLGRISASTIDPKGRVVQELAGTLTPVSYGYDLRGRLANVAQGARTSTLAYDNLGNLASITDPAGRTSAFTYDLAGRVTAQTLSDGRQIVFTYDANGNVTSITPPGKPAHAFTYTPVDLQGSYTPPDVGIGPTATTYAYNLDKQLTTITRPDGQQVGFGYDATGRLATIASPFGQTAFAYDPQKGQLTGLTTPDGQTLAYTHDGFLETGVQWSGAVNGSVSRTYNNDFRVSETKVNGANPVQYLYDNDGLLTKVGDLAITRDAANGLINGTALGQVTDSRSYNALGELAGYTGSVGGSAVYSVTFNRDILGRIAQKVEKIQGATNASDYSYDVAGRLIQVVKTAEGGSPLTTTYAYDPNGNRLSKTDPSGTVTGTYDAQDRLLQYGNITYTSNANGDLTSKTQNGATIAYDYDVFGNLRHVTLDNGIEIDYVIDGRNRRIGKKINGTLVQGFLYDDQLRIAAELDGDNQIVSRFVYGAHVNVPELIIKGGATYRILTDHLGSPRLVINTADGSIAQRMDYDEWGQVFLDTNAGFQPFGFAGGVYDTQTKLVRFGARDYDAGVGRWTAKDPIGLGGGPNQYGYALADPVGLTDSTGLAVICFYEVECPVLICLSEDEIFVTEQVWSGRGMCRNKSSCETKESWGPIPRGTWDMGCLGCTRKHPGLPRVPLAPRAGTDFFGRGQFQLHSFKCGSSGADASQGCIVMPCDVYQRFLDFYRKGGNRGWLRTY